MWQAAALVNGAWGELDLVDLGPEPFSSDAVRRIAREHLPNSRLLHYLDQEAETSGHARDAIELWSQSAQAEAREFDWAGPAKIEALEEALALLPRYTPTEHPSQPGDAGLARSHGRHHSTEWQRAKNCCRIHVKSS